MDLTVPQAVRPFRNGHITGGLRITADVYRNTANGNLFAVLQRHRGLGAGNARAISDRIAASN